MIVSRVYQFLLVSNQNKENLSVLNHSKDNFSVYNSSLSIIITEDKIIRIIEFLVNKSDWKVWSGNLLAQGNKKGQKKILEGRENIPNQSQYE